LIREGKGTLQLFPYETHRKYFMSVLGEKGQYDHNRKAGLWTYCDWDKEVYLTYDHSKNELVSFRPDTVGSEYSQLIKIYGRIQSDTAINRIYLNG
jgi:hypothetical protein